MRNEIGFTIIELMIVVSIVGILATLVLASLAESRDRAENAKVKAQVTQAKAAAELYFGQNQNYGTVPGVSQTTGGFSCTGSLYTDPSSGMMTLANPSTYPPGTNLICVQNLLNFAIAGSLSTAGEYWCVDSRASPGIITIDNPASIVMPADDDDSCAELDTK